jgi:phosphatidylethanolamine-binding protein (PEBP) family uncharacterized protein
VPPEAQFLKNGDGAAVYLGPCPGKGKSSTYEFTLIARATAFNEYDKYPFPAQLVGALSADALAVSSVSGQYTQQP